MSYVCIFPIRHPDAVAAASCVEFCCSCGSGHHVAKSEPRNLPYFVMCSLLHNSRSDCDGSFTSLQGH